MGFFCAEHVGEHRHRECLRFPRKVARAYPDQQLHLVMGSYAAHKRVEVRNRL